MSYSSRAVSPPTSDDHVVQLSSALSQQIDYNRSLLSQLKGYQEQQDATDSIGKQADVKYNSVLQGLSEVRMENATMRNEKNSMIGELDVTKKELVSSKHVVDDQQRELQRMRKEYDSLLVQHHSLEHENKKLVQGLEQFTVEGNKVSLRISELERERDAALSRANDLEHRVAANDVGRNQSFQQLQLAFDTANMNLRQERERADNSEAKLNAALEASRISRENEQRLTNRVVQLENEVRVKDEELQMRIMKLTSTDTNLNDIRGQMESQRLSFESERRDWKLHQESLDVQAQGLKKEITMLQHRLHEESNERTKEIKRHHEEVNNVKTNMELDTQSQVSSLQRQNSRLQQEYTELHELLQKAQRDQMDSAKMLEEEREKYDSKLQHLHNTLDSVQREKHQSEIHSESRVSEMSREVLTLKTTLNDLSSMHMNTLASLQQQLRQVGVESASVTDQYTDTQARLNEIDLELRGMFQQNDELKGDLLKDVKRLVGNDLKVVSERSQYLDAEMEKMKHMLHVSEVEREEMRSTVLMAQESSTKNEQELMDTRTKLKTAEGLVSELAKDRNMLQNDLQSQLEISNDQRRNLQQDNQRLTEQLMETQQRWRQRVTTLEEHMEDFRQLRESVSREKEHGSMELESLRRLHEQTKHELQAENARLASEVETLRTRAMGSHEYLEQIRKLKEENAKYQHQLQVNQHLMQMVSEDRHKQQQQMHQLSVSGSHGGVSANGYSSVNGVNSVNGLSSTTSTVVKSSMQHQHNSGLQTHQSVSYGPPPPMLTNGTSYGPGGMGNGVHR
eukprot:GFYU01002799.1.p1 GENE.GFYU01002799.1~~GFYU01002799.1.p1  ORF type:complete len:795 (-),score=257.04 GFYU01002799.1:77-2461(-)